LPVAHWLEERPETIAVYRLTQNFSEIVDPNMYFFANHPRERVGINEVEKFPYILLPLFVYGVILLVSGKQHGLFIVSLGVPALYYVLYGTGNGLEPFLLFPFILISIFTATEELQKKNIKIIWKAAFWILYFLVLIQGIIYAIY
jgi:hypothetical protein